MPKLKAPADPLMLAIAAGLGVVLGMILEWFVPLKTQDTVTSGDLLSLAGSIIGVIGAVAGAVMIEERKRKVAADADRSFLRDALTSLNAVLGRFSRDERYPGNAAAQAEAILADLTELEEASILLEHARDSAKELTFNQLREVHRAAKTITKFRPKFDREATFVAQSPTAAVLDNFYANVNYASEQMSPVIATTLAALR